VVGDLHAFGEFTRLPVVSAVRADVCTGQRHEYVAGQCLCDVEQSVPPIKQVVESHQPGVRTGRDDLVGQAALACAARSVDAEKTGVAQSCWSTVEQGEDLIDDPAGGLVAEVRVV